MNGCGSALEGDPVLTHAQGRWRTRAGPHSSRTGLVRLRRLLDAAVRRMRARGAADRLRPSWRAKWTPDLLFRPRRDQGRDGGNVLAAAPLLHRGLQPVGPSGWPVARRCRFLRQRARSASGCGAADGLGDIHGPRARQLPRCSPPHRPSGSRVGLAVRIMLAVVGMLRMSFCAVLDFMPEVGR